MTTRLKRTYMRSLKLAMFKRKKEQMAARQRYVCHVESAHRGEHTPASDVHEEQQVIYENQQRVGEEQYIVNEDPRRVHEEQQRVGEEQYIVGEDQQVICEEQPMDPIEEHLHVGDEKCEFKPNTLVEICPAVDKNTHTATVESCLVDEPTLKRSRLSVKSDTTADSGSFISEAAPELSLHESASFVDLPPNNVNHIREGESAHETDLPPNNVNHEDDSAYEADLVGLDTNSSIDIQTSPDSLGPGIDLPIRSSSPLSDVNDAATNQDNGDLRMGGNDLGGNEAASPAAAESLDISKENTENTAKELSRHISENMFERTILQAVESLAKLHTRIVEFTKQGSTKLLNLELKVIESQKIVDKAVKEADMQRVRANMLEESSDYLHKQNERLRASNHHFTVAVNTICAVNSNLKRSVDDFAILKKELQGAYMTVNDELERRSTVFKECLCKISKEITLLGESLSRLNVLETRDHILRYIEDTEAQHNAETRHLRSTNDELLQQATKLKCENSELCERNEQLVATNVELKEEIQLKESYLKDLERSMDEVTASDKFYQDQLIASDRVIKELKQAKQKACCEFSAELEEVRKAFLKENGLLKLQIEELEDELKRSRG